MTSDAEKTRVVIDTDCGRLLSGPSRTAAIGIDDIWNDFNDITEDSTLYPDISHNIEPT